MRNVLKPEQLEPSALKAMESFHSDVINEVTQAVANNKVVVIGMKQNPFVKKARNLLTEAGLQYKYLEYGSYFGMWKPRLAIKLWSGWPTFPQVFADGKLIGGFQETEAWLKNRKSN